jgi:hypothetical protein
MDLHPSLCRSSDSFLFSAPQDTLPASFVSLVLFLKFFGEFPEISEKNNLSYYFLEFLPNSANVVKACGVKFISSHNISNIKLLKSFGWDSVNYRLVLNQIEFLRNSVGQGELEEGM